MSFWFQTDSTQIQDPKRKFRFIRKNFRFTFCIFIAISMNGTISTDILVIKADLVAVVFMRPKFWQA